MVITTMKPSSIVRARKSHLSHPSALLIEKEKCEFQVSLQRRKKRARATNEKRPGNSVRTGSLRNQTFAMDNNCFFPTFAEDEQRLLKTPKLLPAIFFFPIIIVVETLNSFLFS